MNPRDSFNTLKKLVRRLPLTICIALAALTVVAVPQFAEALQFDRSAIANHEAWRLLTCHVTHWNFEHFSWDWLMFVVLGGICEWRSNSRMHGCVLAGVVAVSAVVWYFCPGILQYRGLSGIDTALFTFLAADVCRESRRTGDRWQALFAAGLLAAFVGKTAYEAVFGQTIFVDHQAAGFVPIVWDHVAGAALGVLLALRSTLRRYFFRASAISRRGLSAEQLKYVPRYVK